ncbi:hypothetical protein IH992_04550 [Candidatus Poribacteria bacterium]|nr:hypothetical protein [Candidatus Poribacteria bacterium]
MEYLLQIKAVCSRIRAKMVLIDIPVCVQVDTKYLNFYKSIGFDVGAEMTKANKPQQRLADFAKKHDLPFLDLLPIFASHPEMELYYSHDDHWTIAGHQLAAESIKDFLIQQSLIYP